MPSRLFLPDTHVVSSDRIRDPGRVRPYRGPAIASPRTRPQATSGDPPKNGYPLIGIAATGEPRHQFCHVIDVAPTVLDAAHLPFPTIVNGIAQGPFHEASMRYCVDDPAAAERREMQYFEMQGNRGIYHEGP